MLGTNPPEFRRARVFAWRMSVIGVLVTESQYTTWQLLLNEALAVAAPTARPVQTPVVK